jgi:DUF4097 and DUF4098 domain-containing protein YvlB
MPTFETPEPISVTVDLGVGDVRITASDRTDTIVEVRPTDPGKDGDVTAAAQARVEYASGRLVVRAQKGWRQWRPRGGHESIDVVIDVPSGSSIEGEVGVASARCSGRLGDCRIRAGVGDVRIDEAGSLELRTGAGDLTVERADGSAEVRTGSGAVRIAAVEGSAVVRNGNGDTWVGEVTGDVRVNAGNGSISIERARAGVVAKTASGRVRLGEVERGAVVAQSGFGTIEVGVRDGVAAWLDLDTKFGSVQTDLDPSSSPEPGEDAVEIHAHTSMGDVTIRRSTASHAGRHES